MKHFILLLIAASAAFAQLRDAGRRELTPLLFSELGAPNDGAVAYCSNCTQANPTAAGGPGAFVRREAGVWNGGGGSGGGAAYEPCKPTTAGAVLTIAQPCAVRWQNIRVGPTTAQTLTITGGSGTTVVRVYMSESGQLYAEHTTSAGITFSATSGLTPLSVTTPSYGTDMVPIAEVQITAGAWGTVASQFANMSRDPIVAGADIVISNVTGRQSIAAGVNLARLGGANTWTGNNDFRNASLTAPNRIGATTPGTCTVGETFFNTTSATLFQCTAADTWTAVGSGGGGSSELQIPITPTSSLFAATTDPGSGPAFANITWTKTQTIRYGWTFKKQSNTVILRPYFLGQDGTGSAGNAVVRMQLFCISGTSTRLGLMPQIGSNRDVNVALQVGQSLLPSTTVVNESFDVSSCGAGSQIGVTLGRIDNTPATAPEQPLVLGGGTYVP